MKYYHKPKEIRIFYDMRQEAVKIFTYNDNPDDLDVIRKILAKMTEQVDILIAYGVERVIFLNKLETLKAELRLQV
jgi:hypothetical protein